MARKQKPQLQGNGSDQLTASAELARQGEDTNGEIIPANLRALESVYFAAMLEEARLFEVVDRLAARFSRGLLSLGRTGWAARRDRCAGVT